MLLLYAALGMLLTNMQAWHVSNSGGVLHCPMRLCQLLGLSGLGRASCPSLWSTPTAATWTSSSSLCTAWVRCTSMLGTWWLQGRRTHSIFGKGRTMLKVRPGSNTGANVQQPSRPITSRTMCGRLPTRPGGVLQFQLVVSYSLRSPHAVLHSYDTLPVAALPALPADKKYTHLESYVNNIEMVYIRPWCEN